MKNKVNIGKISIYAAISLLLASITYAQQVTNPFTKGIDIYGEWIELSELRKMNFPKVYGSFSLGLYDYFTALKDYPTELTLTWDKDSAIKLSQKLSKEYRSYLIKLSKTKAVDIALMNLYETNAKVPIVFEIDPFYFMDNDPQIIKDLYMHVNYGTGQADSIVKLYDFPYKAISNIEVPGQLPLILRECNAIPFDELSRSLATLGYNMTKFDKQKLSIAYNDFIQLNTSLQNRDYSLSSIPKELRMISMLGIEASKLVMFGYNLYPTFRNNQPSSLHLIRYKKRRSTIVDLGVMQVVNDMSIFTPFYPKSASEKEITPPAELGHLLRDQFAKSIMGIESIMFIQGDYSETQKEELLKVTEILKASTLKLTFLLPYRKVSELPPAVKKRLADYLMKNSVFSLVDFQEQVYNYY